MWFGRRGAPAEDSATAPAVDGSPQLPAKDEFAANSLSLSAAASNAKNATECKRVHPAGRIRNFGMRNRAAEINMSSNFLNSKIKNIVYEPTRIVFLESRGAKTPDFDGVGNPKQSPKRHG